MNEWLAAALQKDNAVMMTIKRLTDQYIARFHCEPHYVKIPNFIYRKIQLCNAIILQEDADARDKGTVTVMGLIACPTSSISTIDEIEVF